MAVELKGNEFELSRSNHFSLYGEWVVTLQTNETQRQFIDGIQEHYIAKGWNFHTALMSRSTPELPTLTIVFNNPQKESMCSKFPDPVFLSPDSIEKAKKARILTHNLSMLNQWDLVHDKANELLRGTEFQAYSVRSMYDEVYGNRRFFFWDRPTLYREGVVLIDISLERVMDLVRQTNASLSNKAAEIIRAQVEKEALERKLAGVRILAAEQTRTLF